MQRDAPADADGVGTVALLAGVAAALGAAIPMVGDMISAPLAALAMILGFAGIRRHESGAARRILPAVFGTILGALALLIIGFVFVATNVRG